MEGIKKGRRRDMYLTTLFAYSLVVRPGICVGIFAIVMLSTWIASPESFPLVSALLGSMAVALAAGAGSVVNDALDWRADELNNPNRVLPRHLLTEGEAWRFYFVLLAISSVLFWLVSVQALLIGVGMSALLFLYSLQLRKVNGLLSNVVIAASVGTALAFGSVITEHFTAKMMLLFGFGFSVTLAREILGDVTDLKGDRREKLRTLPITWGVSNSLWGASSIIYVVALFSYTPLVIAEIFDPSPFGVAASAMYLLALTVATSVSLGSIREKSVRTAQNMLKGALLFYPVAMAIGNVLR